MKILYRQNRDPKEDLCVIKHDFKNCYFKKITYKNDYKITTSKSHSHTEYEIHIVFNGIQRYEIDGIVYELGKNDFIIIPPKTRHRVIFATGDLFKYSITVDTSHFFPSIASTGKATDDIINAIEFIDKEFECKTTFSFTLIQNRVFEILFLLNRISGFKEQVSGTDTSIVSNRLHLAKKFILDNIERNLSVKDVSAYCHLSTRQLSRIFMDSEGISPAKYINREMMTSICEYIKNTDLSLKQISEHFSFNNEYYFNTAFKKHFGMTPLTYRKMYR